MTLLYKQHLLNEFDHIHDFSGFFADFWKNEAIAYYNALGFGETADYYLAYSAIKSTKDDEFCGMLENHEPLKDVHYYLYSKERDEIYWFKSPNDACYFAASYNNTTPVFATQGDFNFKQVFEDNRRKVVDDLTWLTDEDFDYIEVAQVTNFIRCVEKDMTFQSIDEAAEWVINSGKAKAAKAAVIKNIQKNLDGLTKYSYSYTWKRA